MIQDTTRLLSDPVGTLDQFRALGANTIRVVVFWYQIAPRSGSSKKPNFNASDPNAYPARNWDEYDAIVRDAKQAGINVDFTVAGGSPVWADGSGIPRQGKDPHFAWKPNPKYYGQFMHAVGERYDGHFAPKGQSTLPAVRFWALWNEPNFGEDLGPQAINGSRVSVAPMYYRNLVNQGWNALHQTGHGRDRILIGEFAARGLGPSGPRRGAPQGLPGDYGQTKPLQFIRTLYCLDGSYRHLSGSYARAVGCPTSASASRRFRTSNPGLFNASGVGDHPYAGGGSPVTDGRNDPDFATFPNLGRLESALDRVNRVYGSGKHYSIYNDEYGYITNPPNRQKGPGGAHYVSPATAAYYINWAEYLSWKSGRVASYMQYLLADPAPTAGLYAGFASGLYFSTGRPKPSLDAYRLPLYMPKTSFGHSRAAEVWGDVRPASFAGKQPVSIQLQKGGHGGYTTVATVRSGGYFDIHTRFPSSGNVRLSYTYPRSEVALPANVAGSTIISRSVKIKVG